MSEDVLVIDPERMKVINKALSEGREIALSEREAYLLGFDLEAEPEEAAE